MNEFKINRDLMTMKAVPDCTQKDRKVIYPNLHHNSNDGDATSSSVIHRIESNNLY
jgi:hypothetical protein